MAERPPESLTLREKFIEAEKLTRELSDHLERGFIPKAHKMRQMARRANQPDHQDEVRDVTIRSSVDQLLQNEDYARQLCERARGLLAAISKDVTEIFDHG